MLVIHILYLLTLTIILTIRFAQYIFIASYFLLEAVTVFTSRTFQYLMNKGRVYANFSESRVLEF